MRVPTNPAQLEGQQLGGYRIHHRIGSGGMAVVYRAVRTDGRRGMVAIKVLAPELRGNAQFEALFKREAAEMRRAGGLPGVVRFIEHDQIAGISFIAMELVDGVSLDELIGRALERGAAIPAPIAAALIGPPLRALAGLAGLDPPMVHRDPTTSNILLSLVELTTILADFGIAKDRDCNLTAAGAGRGTPAYVDPSLAEGHPCDESSDRFALGVTLLRLLRTDRYARVEFQPDGAPTLGDLPTPWTRFLSALLHRRRSERFKSYDAALTAFAALAEEGAAVDLGRFVLTRPARGQSSLGSGPAFRGSPWPRSCGT